MAELNLGHVVGPGVPTGGTSGQILKKNSSTNFDTSWTNNDATTIPMSSSDSTTINEAISNYISSGVSKQISSGSANDIVTPGRYYVTSAVTDLPVSGSSGYLDVYVYTSNRVAQSFRPYDSESVYERRSNNGTFGSWKELTNVYQIQTGADLHTLLTPGIYKSSATTSGVSGYSNCPVTVPFTLIVTGSGASGAGTVQTIMTDEGIYVSRSTSSGFGDWIPYAKDGTIRVQISANGSYTIKSGLPNAYIAITETNAADYLSAIIGVGYGSSATRHKISNLITSSGITYAVATDAYGLTITNGGSATVNVRIVSLW